MVGQTTNGTEERMGEGQSAGEPVRYDSALACAQAVIDHVGKEIVLGLPLGVGKANHLTNAFYDLAAADRSLSLTIFTALTLERPQPGSDLEARLLNPILDRLIGANYPHLHYARDRRAGCLPDNVTVQEFFLAPGSLLSNTDAQQNYISTNYTHGARDVLAAGVNVLAQMIRPSPRVGLERVSLSANPDLSLDVIPAMRAQAARGRKVAVLGEINDRLPFLANDAAVPGAWFDGVIEPEPYPLFGPVSESVSLRDYAIGLHCAALVRDAGTLQIGFGSLGDAVSQALILRHQKNEGFREIISALEGAFSNMVPAHRNGGLEAFEAGLYGSSEMVFDGFLHLLDAGILSREVYDHGGLQRALNDGVIGRDVSDDTLEVLIDRGIIAVRITEDDLAFLHQMGCVDETVRLEAGRLIQGADDLGPADLSDPQIRARLCGPCLGRRLGGGRVLEGAFYMGTRAFYERLRAMSARDCARFNMTSVTKINDLFGDEGLRRLQRRHARFINTAMMVTGLGAIVSDGLEDGRVVSGVGGQYNFVAMAHELEDARSIIALRATRTSGGRVTTTMPWSYGHVTVPRHLRDMVVTEYGIADLRARTDREVVVRLLAICDSRFQETLLTQAKQAGKIEASYQIPDAHRGNTPERLAAVLKPFQAKGHLPAFPFGTDLTAEELALSAALRPLKEDVASLGGMLRLGWGALTHWSPPQSAQPYLERMGLTAPASFQETVMRALVVAQLARTGRL